MFSPIIIKCKEKREYFSLYFAFVISYLLVYGMVVCSVYAFSDDYGFMADMGFANPVSLITGIVQGGRPVYAIYSSVFSLIGSISDLSWLRLLSILGIGAFASLMYYNLRQYTNLPSGVVFAASLACGFMPAFQVYSAWAVTSIFPWAASLSGLSALCLLSKGNLWRMVAAASFLMIAIFTYQPAGMVFWAFLLPTFLSKPISLRLSELPLRSLVVMASALVADFIASKILPALLFSNPPRFERAALVTDYIGKIDWLLHEVIPDSLSLFSVAPKTIYYAPVALIIFFGVILSRNPLSILRALGVVVAVVIFSYLPNLVIKENWASYRSQAGIGSVIIILVFISIFNICCFLRLRPLATGVSFATALVGGLVAHWNVNEYFVMPQVKELTLIENYLMGRTSLYQSQRLFLIPSELNDASSTVMRYDEFGLPSSVQVWVPLGMTWSILRESKGGLPKSLAHVTVGKKREAPSGEGVLVIDMGEALKYARAN